MMQRNPRAFLRAAATVLLRPATVAVPQALTIAPRAPPPTRRPLFPAHRRALSTNSLGNDDTETNSHGKSDTRPVDIMELPGGYSYVLDVPGLRAGDLTVSLEPDGWITVSGERREEYEAGACIYRRKHRPMGELEHCFRLPHDADLGTLSAVCRDGVLTMIIQKLPPPPELVTDTIIIPVHS